MGGRWGEGERARACGREWGLRLTVSPRLFVTVRWTRQHTDPTIWNQLLEQSQGEP